jgi:hypothetical protein
MYAHRPVGAIGARDAIAAAKEAKQTFNNELVQRVTVSTWGPLQEQRFFM